MINPIRILIGVMLISLFNLITVFAEITIDGETTYVETDGYKVQFDRGVITHLHNKLTGETYTLPFDINRNPGFRAETGILGRHHSVWARHAHTVETRKIDSDNAEIVFRRDGNEIRLLIGIDSDTDELLIGGKGVSDRSGIYGMQWGIENLNISNLRLIIPSERRQIVDAASGVKYRNFRYPSYYWEAQLAIIEAERGGFYVRGTDKTFQFKNLNYQSDGDSFGLGFQTHNHAPWETLTSAQSVTWRLNTYAGDWCIPAQIHRDWMEEAFDPWKLSNMPAWINDIGFVAVHSTLNKEVLELLAELVDPTKTLLYLTDWREGGHDVNHPDYSTPHKRFEGVLETARQHGFRVMLHVNVHNCSPSHPLYPEFKRFQYRHPWNGELSGWLWDDIDHPQRNAHISLASSKWRNLLVQEFKVVWEKYKVDAFFLDTTHYVVNDANGLIEGITSAEGNVLIHKELAAAMPGVVFSGEHLHEVTFFRESFTRRGITQGPLHPISAFLFGPYTLSHGGIGVPSTDDPDYRLYLDTAESQGYLPTTWTWAKEAFDIPLIQQLLSVAHHWQALGLRPNVNCDWGPNTLFQYTTHTGETVTHQRKPSGAELILPNDDGYERVYGVTQVQTHRSLPLWRAYNETSLLGLDPNRYYFLDNAPRDFSQLRVNSLSPNVSVRETRVTDRAALFRFKSTASDQQATIGFFLPTPPVGSIPDTLRHIGSGHYTVEADLSQPVVIFRTSLSQISLPYNLKEAQFNAGLQLDGIFRLGSHHGSGDHRTATIDDIYKRTIFGHPPRHGQTILQFLLLLPQEPSTFSFSAGLEAGCSEGVLFQVRINGQTHSEIFTDTFEWKEGNISLSAFAGQPLLLELVTDPSGSSNCDWAHWADLRITAVPNPDANLDGEINVLDLIVVASSFNEQPPSNPLADTNKDGVVNLFDLVFVTEHLSQNAAAPSQLALIESIPATAKKVIAAQRALSELEAIPNKSQGVQIAIELLRHYLSIADRNVQETKLLPNYPNPFNPDTWIPYQLSEGTIVTVKIYDVSGSLVRTIGVGHNPVGYYLTRERAVYWDGRNESGEPVSSGVYFYTLNTDTYTQTRRMVIVK